MAVLKSVSELKNSVAALLSGIDLNNVADLNGALERAARVFIQKADPPEATITQNITLYAGVTDYPCSDKIFGTQIKDIRPQGVSRNPWDYVAKTFPDDFDRNKNWLPSGTMATFEYLLGAPIIRIVSRVPVQEAILDPMNQTTGWTVGGNATNLNQDVTDFYQSPASLRFDISTSGSANLSKTLQSPLDIASYEGVGVGFLAIQVPEGSTPTDLNYINLQLGSSSSNYDQVTATTGFLGDWVAGEWVLISFNFANATATGTPDWSAIDYVNVVLNTDSAFTNFRTGYLFISLPSSNQIISKSAAIFLPVSSTIPLTTITANTDTITLTNPSYTIYQYEAALSVLQMTGGAMADSMTARLNEILHGTRAGSGAGPNFGLYDLYRGDNPSQDLRTSGNYYPLGGGYNNYRGDGY